MARVLSWAPDVLVLLVIALHVALAPYAKVEESFNLQATHDVLYHGRDLGRYDHHDFPGVVPRTFAGAVVLAGLVAPIKWLIERSDSIGSLDGDAVAMQIVARLALGACTALAIARFRFALASRIGAPASVAFALLTATSFHQTFYASRTLPNVFALILATHAMADWLLATGDRDGGLAARDDDARARRCVLLLVAAVVLFRCDVVLLLVPVATHLLWTRAIAIADAAWWGARCVLACLAVTVALDTIMWRPPEDATRSIAPSTTHWPGATGVLWPEGRVAFFNTVLNKSSEWGVSPWHWYFTSALPRALTVSYPLSLVGAALERRVRAALAIGLFYVVVISRLPHKELRFVFPTLPLFTACAAAAVGRAWTRRAKITRCVLGMLLSRRAKKKTRTKRGGKYKRAGVAELIWALFAAVVVLAWCLGVAAHVAFALGARCNYPGGVALARLHALRADVPGTVHVDADAATTGASRFGQVRRVLLHTGSHTTAFAW